MRITLHDGGPTIEIREPEPGPVRHPASGAAWRRLVPSRRTCLAAIVAIAAAWALMTVPSIVRQSRKDRCRANLKSIGLALVAYQDAHGHYPAAAITDGRGRPLLSWRVAILPQLGHRSLYEQFRLDEPWDSHHNRALASRMPPIYACPGLADRREFVTGYQVAVGPGPQRPEPGALTEPGTMFQWTQGVEVREVLDGPSGTLMVAETERAIPWTRPDDPRYKPGGPLPRFGGGHPGGFHAVLADGTVRFLTSRIAPDILRGLLTRDGNEILDAG